MRISSTEMTAEKLEVLHSQVLIRIWKNMKDQRPGDRDDIRFVSCADVTFSLETLFESVTCINSTRCHVAADGVPANSGWQGQVNS
jgi:hypothetical protein